MRSNVVGQFPQQAGDRFRAVGFGEKPSALGQVIFPDIHKARGSDDPDRRPASPDGKADSPVRVRAITQGGEFELTVANYGAAIPAEAIDRLFQPFYRVAQDSRQGLGLGLYISSAIARAHGGRIEVASSPQETRFTFRMPI